MKRLLRTTTCLVLWTIAESSNWTVENLIAKSSAALGKSYSVSCTVLLHPHNPKLFPLELFTITKLMSSLLTEGQGTVVTKNIDDFKELLKTMNKSTTRNGCSRPMYVLVGVENLLRDPFTKLTKQIPMSGPVWIVYLRPNTNAVEFLEEVNAPFDGDMVVARVQTNGTVTLEEVYRASSKKPVRILYYGFWTADDKGLSTRQTSKYTRRSDFEGIVFQVGIFDIPEEREKMLKGYFGKVWGELELRLNFSSNYVYSNDSTNGIKIGTSWTGILGMIQRGEATIGMSALTITPSRYEVARFLRPLVISSHRLYFKHSGSNIYWKAIAQPFALSIWLLIMGWIILASIFLSIFIRLAGKYNLENLRVYNEFTMKNTIFIVFQAFLQQSHFVTPSSSACRILFISSYIVAAILLTAYSASCISYIAIKIPKSPFKDLQELIGEGSYSLIAMANSASYSFFANATNPDDIKVFNRLMKNKVMPKSNHDGLSQVCNNSRLVFFGAHSDAYVEQRELNAMGCKIRVHDKLFNIIYQSIAIEKESQYTGALNHHLSNMYDRGILHRMRNNMSVILKKNTQKKGFSSVEVEQVLFLFTMLCAGMFLSAIFFLCEHKFGKTHIR